MTGVAALRAAQGQNGVVLAFHRDGRLTYVEYVRSGLTPVFTMGAPRVIGTGFAGVSAAKATGLTTTGTGYGAVVVTAVQGSDLIRVAVQLPSGTLTRAVLGTGLAGTVALGLPDLPDEVVLAYAADGTGRAWGRATGSTVAYRDLGPCPRLSPGTAR